MKNIIALAGTPNCGKTTLFNSLTKSRAATGNWAGVTVQKNVGRLSGLPETEMIDLPGIYSLTPFSLEENVTRDFLINEHPPVICVIDGTNPEHGIYLALELRSLGISMALAVNFADELDRLGGRADIAALQKELGAPAFLISAKSGKGMNELVSAVKQGVFGKASPQASPLSEKERHETASRIAESCFTYGQKDSGFLERLDSFLTESRFSILVCVLLLLTMFFTVFGYPGTVLKTFVDAVFEKLTFLAGLILSVLKASDWVRLFVTDGIIGGFASVTSFLPQIGLMFFIISFLEDSGYMSRAAFVSDKFLRRFGLSGRSVIPVLMGFGCSVPAVLAAKASLSEKEKMLTVSVLPFISCSAKLPLYLLFAAELFPRHRGTAVICIYLLGIIFAAAFCLITKPRQNFGFILEIPPCRLPSLKSIFKSTADKCRGFVIKAGTVVVFANAAIWALSFFGPGFFEAPRIEESFLGMIGQLAAPFFEPLGFGWQGAVPLFCGLAAKEAGLSALLLISGGDIKSVFTFPGAISFLLFFMLYSPCAAALAAIRKELGAKKAAWVFFFQTALAYLVSFSFYRIAVLL